jgi:hypothetical protein
LQLERSRTQFSVEVESVAARRLWIEFQPRENLAASQLCTEGDSTTTGEEVENSRRSSIAQPSQLFAKNHSHLVLKAFRFPNQRRLPVRFRCTNA